MKKTKEHTMSKPILVFQAPLFTRSGYGDHARDILRSLYEIDKFDVKVVPTRWGNTPQNQISPNTEFGRRVFSSIITQLDRKPEVYIQMSVANEFRPVGNYNIGITAGVETTVIPKEFIDGSNKMDLVIVPSQFTKHLFEQTKFNEQHKQTGQIIRTVQNETPVEVLFEGVDLSRYEKPKKEFHISELDNIETDFNFLFVGHWLKGNIGQDRKDIGMMIKTFCTVFKSLPKERQPGLILKTSHAGFSVIDRETIREKIDSITEPFGDDTPPIYLLHGDLLDDEMASLYHHDKVKAMLSFTKGEGYGRPLAEFTLTGKPIIVSKWSGQTDFLPEEHTVYLDGQLTQVHDSAADKFILKESKWFTVDYSRAANKLYSVYNDYDKYKKMSEGLVKNTKKNFSLERMHEVFEEIMDRRVGNVPTQVPFQMPNSNKPNLPKMKKLDLPKLKKK